MNISTVPEASYAIKTSYAAINNT